MNIVSFVIIVLFISEHAFKFLADDGIMVAILPASAKGKELIKGAEHEYSRIYENEFQGTSISVVIVRVRKW